MDPRSFPTRVWTGTNSAYLWEMANLYSDRDRLTTRLTFLHEIGHVFDLATPGPKGYRRAFMRAMGKRWSGWWSASYEQFAMGYAFCAMYPHYDDAAFARSVWWGYNYNPTREHYERVCFAIRHAAQYDRRGRFKRAVARPTVDTVASWPGVGSVRRCRGTRPPAPPCAVLPDRSSRPGREVRR